MKRKERTQAIAEKVDKRKGVKVAEESDAPSQQARKVEKMN